MIWVFLYRKCVDWIWGELDYHPPLAQHLYHSGITLESTILWLDSVCPLNLPEQSKVCSSSDVSASFFISIEVTYTPGDTYIASIYLCQMCARISGAIHLCQSCSENFDTKADCEFKNYSTVKYVDFHVKLMSHDQMLEINIAVIYQTKWSFNSKLMQMKSPTWHFCHLWDNKCLSSGLLQEGLEKMYSTNYLHAYFWVPQQWENTWGVKNQKSVIFNRFNVPQESWQNEASWLESHKNGKWLLWNILQVIVGPRLEVPFLLHVKSDSLNSLSKYFRANH